MLVHTIAGLPLRCMTVSTPPIPNLAGGLGAEFDVPKCAEGVPGCSKGVDGTWVHTVIGIQKPRVHPGSQLVAAHMHCHAPTCLSAFLEQSTSAMQRLRLCRLVLLLWSNLKYLPILGQA